ncbi:MAG: hypothetical protein Q4E69_06960 [Bacilli bacterium]|nr:hypothetical protein [Bacilli bacterium]
MKINKNLLFTICLLIIVMTGIVGYSYINGDINSTSTITVTKYDCTQSNLYDRLACMSVMDNVKSKYVSSSTGINYSQVSSDTNGKGLYTFASSAGDTYPIYYYRGNINNNYVKFAGYCWQIVRTTDTGGTKLIYSGEPDGSGHCTATGTGKTAAQTLFNGTGSNSVSYIGYMLGPTYYIQSGSLSDTYLYGNDVNYITDSTDPDYGKYVLQDTTSDTSLLNTHHYTCYNDTGKCSTVSYMYLKGSTTGTHILLTGGDKIEDAVAKFTTNTNSSLAKQAVDNFFANYLIPNITALGHTYSDYLEDTIWCNNRDMETTAQTVELRNNGFLPDGGNLSYATYQNGYRMSQGKINLKCPNKNDSFTKTETTEGNGKLTYPSALITVDEAYLAGKDTADNYLMIGENTWTMSPYRINGQSSIYILAEGNGISGHHVHYTDYIRPMISLNHSQVIASGIGTQDNPYIIN